MKIGAGVIPGPFLFLKSGQSAPWMQAMNLAFHAL
jgi:hypothetical protein